MKTLPRTTSEKEGPATTGTAGSASASKSIMPNIVRTTIEDRVAVLTFDHPDSSANIFDKQTLEELDGHLSNLEDARALIITSAKPSIFIAGADLKSLTKARGATLIALIERGQQVFQRLADLPIPTIAAIHGACVGGGYELALACDWRVASLDSATKIGLPETMLGILPAWGGSTRLPELIGLPKALDMILGGKVVAAKHAKKLGMIDDLAPRERLVDRAVQLIEKSPERPSHFLTNNMLAAKFISEISERKLARKARGNYSALPRALEVACRSVSLSTPLSLRNERDAVVALADTPEAKNLMRVFFLQENAKKFRRDPKVVPRTIDRTAVVGAGVMGSGIAQWLASREFPVVLQDIDEERVAAGMRNALQLFNAGVKRRVFSEREARLKLDRIAPAADPVPLNSVDVVIEAAVENLEIKKKIFADLCKRTRPDTVLATNTSALPIGEIEVTNPERLVGLHFFNPVHRMKLVEIVVTDKTSEETVETMLRFVRQLGKLPVVVRDRPGFLVNRMLMPYLIEAGRLVVRGVPAEAIDEAMLDFGMPMGPLRLLDEIGLDVALHVCDTMEHHFGERFAAPSVLKRMVDSGDFGKKSGSGFYRYEKGSKNETGARFKDRAPDLTKPEIAERLALLMANEGFRVLEENVARCADDVDFAMIQGTGFAPFRGGPMTWSKMMGLRTTREKLTALAEAEGENFRPAALLISAANLNSLRDYE